MSALIGDMPSGLILFSRGEWVRYRGKSCTFVVVGELPEWSNGPDCKSGGACLRRFESSTPHLRE